MSDNPNEVPAAPKASRKSAADQVAENKVASAGPREVQQTVTQVVTIPVKEGQTISDAVKDYLVQQGGFEGSAVLPGPTGAIMEREIRESQDMSHPAIDSNPRRGLPPTSMQRDMNDPRFDRQDASQGQAAPATAP